MAASPAPMSTTVSLPLSSASSTMARATAACVRTKGVRKNICAMPVTRKTQTNRNINTMETSTIHSMSHSVQEKYHFPKTVAGTPRPGYGKKSHFSPAHLNLQALGGERSAHLAGVGIYLTGVLHGKVVR